MMHEKLLRLNAQYMKFERYLAVLAGVILLFTMGLQTVSVFMRFVMEQPLASAFEIVRLLFLTSVFLGVSYVQGKKGHIRIEILTNKFPPRLQFFFEFLGLLIAIFVTAIIMWQSGKNAWHAFVTMDHTMGIVQIPLWPAKASIPFGLLVLWIRLLLDFMILLTASRHPHHTQQNQVSL